MACLKSKQIEEIKDIWGMVPVMTALDISYEGCQTLDEMKARVKTELKESVEKPCWTAGKVRTLRMEYTCIKNKFETGNVGDFVWFAINHSKPFSNASFYSDSPVLIEITSLPTEFDRKQVLLYTYYMHYISIHQ